MYCHCLTVYQFTVYISYYGISSTGRLLERYHKHQVMSQKRRLKEIYNDVLGPMLDRTLILDDDQQT